MAGQRAFQLFAAMAETQADVWLRKRIRLGGQMVGQSLRLRPLPMASEVVVGLPRRLRIPWLRIPLRGVSAVLLPGIQVNKQKEVKSMWWPRGRRCWWWYMNPYMMYPPYPPYVQAPQQPSQPAQQPAQQPPAAPYYPLPPFIPPPPTPEQEIESLEAYKAEIEEELKGIEARIKELRESLAKESGGQPPETGK